MGVDEYFSELALSEESSDSRTAQTENNSIFFYVPSSLEEEEAARGQGLPKFSESNNAIAPNTQSSNKTKLDPDLNGFKKQSSTPNKMKLRGHQVEEICQENNLDEMEILRPSHITAKLDNDSRQNSLCANPQRANNLVLVDKINSLRPYFKNQTTLDDSPVLILNKNTKNQSLSLNQNGHLTSRVKANECDTTQIIGPMRINLPTHTIHFKNNGITVIDPVRAALTWQEDEITGYSVIDSEDDGEGINGIGFRPTPTESYIRMEKRKKQLAAYRDQEAKDARILRRERRNRPHNTKNFLKEERKLAKRVRFKEAELKILPF